MEAISVFDIFKIGVGPSSSHTMGPWRAAQRFLAELAAQGLLKRTVRVRTDLYGSLAKTGLGHGTDFAIILGLGGEDPVTCEVEGLHDRVAAACASGRIRLGGEFEVAFDRDADLLFHRDQALPFHANGLRFTALIDDGSLVRETYYSVGGGFVVQEGERASGARAVRLPHPIERGEHLEAHCASTGLDIPGVVRLNERAWREDAKIDAGVLAIWHAMLACMHRGCHTEGVLPGGLEVVRRAKRIHDRLRGGMSGSDPHAERDPRAWLGLVRRSAERDFSRTLRWVSTFALAVNEENAAFGRVVTAPTNGAAGVIPAVLMYHAAFGDSSDRSIIDFLLTAGEIGSLFKKGATISAAMGGCQAEIGVSSAMAAAGLCQVMGGSVGQVLMAAEIAMEHHLGMTCDPIGGLVQVPCIERNTMGALKAITAANIALDSDPAAARVSLDDVIATMWATAQDMQTKYKETAEGGLAVHVSVGISEC
jgi:L-serine dehydratase